MQRYDLNVLDDQDVWKLVTALRGLDTATRQGTHLKRMLTEPLRYTLDLRAQHANWATPQQARHYWSTLSKYQRAAVIQELTDKHPHYRLHLREAWRVVARNQDRFEPSCGKYATWVLANLFTYDGR